MISALFALRRHARSLAHKQDERANEHDQGNDLNEMVAAGNEEGVCPVSIDKQPARAIESRGHEERLTGKVATVSESDPGCKGHQCGDDLVELNWMTLYPEQGDAPG